MALITGILTLMLPETLGKPLMNTMEEAGKMLRKTENKRKPLAEANGVAMEKLDSATIDAPDV